MTRLLIIGDSHGNSTAIQNVLEKETGNFDICIHLGDRAEDMFQFQDKIGNLILIEGNMDFGFFNPGTRPPAEKQVEIEGIKFLITHGHKYKVHSTMLLLMKEAARLKAGVVLYGHTHKKDTIIQNGSTFFNPGALKNGDYGVINVDKGKILNIRHISLKTL